SRRVLRCTVAPPSGDSASSSTPRAWMYFGQLAKTSRVTTSKPSTWSSTRPFSRNRLRLARSMTRIPRSAPSLRFSASGSPAGDRAVDGTPMAGDVGGFTCEEQRAIERHRELTRRAGAADDDPAVGTARKWVRLPVVQMSAPQQVPQASAIDVEELGESRQRE